MNNDKIKGAAKELKGSVETSIGDTVARAKLKIAGAKDAVEDIAQSAIGDIKDALKK